MNSAWDQQQRFVKQTIENRLESRPAWPRQIFRLELEQADIYQDRSNKILNQLEEDGELGNTSLRLGNNDITFLTRPEEPRPEPDDEIKEATEKLNLFFKESSDFSELTAYASLCKIYDEIGENITGMEVLPSNNYPYHLSGFTGQLDGLMRMRDEYIPIEVYNGSDYLSVEKDGNHSKKYKQIRDRHQDEQPVSSPILINRRSDSNLKTQVRNNFNSLAIDTDVIVGCETSHPQIQDTIELFNLGEIIRILPPLETADGQTFDGEEFIQAAKNQQKAETIRPPSVMAKAAEDLPDQYLSRIRGGVQLHYVNSFYRRASGSTGRQASFLLQQIYNRLLRKGGMARRVAIEKGWEDFEDSYRYIKKARQKKEMILEQARTYIKILQDENVISEQNGNIYARNSSHPQPTFSF